MIGVGMSERALTLSMYNTENPTIIIFKLFERSEKNFFLI